MGDESGWYKVVRTFSRERLDDLRNNIGNRQFSNKASFQLNVHRVLHLNIGKLSAEPHVTPTWSLQHLMAVRFRQ